MRLEEYIIKRKREDGVQKAFHHLFFLQSIFLD